MNNKVGVYVTHFIGATERKLINNTINIPCFFRKGFGDIAYCCISEYDDESKSDQKAVCCFSSYEKFVMYNKTHITYGVFVCKIIKNKIRLPKDCWDMCDIKKNDKAKIIGLVDHIAIFSQNWTEPEIDIDMDTITEVLEKYQL